MVRPRIHSEEGVTEAVNTKIYVQVLMEPVKKVSSMDVFNQGDGSYEVKFVAKVPGCHGEDHQQGTCTSTSITDRITNYLLQT